MKPVHFPAVNVVYAKDQPQYLPLPAHRTECGQVTSCWQMTWTERLKCLFTGKAYISMLTFGGPLQPLKVSLDFTPPPSNGPSTSTP